MRLACFLLAIAGFTYFWGTPANAQDWTRFRGPNGTGVSEATTIPTEWTPSDYNWKTELPGLGHSSPVIWGDRVFLLSADPATATRYVLCYNTKDGSEAWKRTFESATHTLHDRSSYASSTPAVDEERVYFGWSTPDSTTLIAFDHHGETVWENNLGPWVSQHGFGTSPIIFKETLILHNSQQANQLEEGVTPGESRMMAFDRSSGDSLWKSPLASRNVCYSVPFIYEPQPGKPELVCTSTGNGVFSLDPTSGAKNWAVDVFDKRTVGSPIFAGGHIFGSTGSGQFSSNYVVAVKPGPSATLAYKLENGPHFKAPYVPSLVAKGDYVFMLYDRGFASCVDARTGAIQWTKARTGGVFSGSPIRVRDKIYCMDDEGVVWVIAADEKEYRLLAKNPLGEPSRSTPAVSGGRLYLRTYSHLISVGG
jgi:outer membrane protein assembly factor BamB